MKRPQRTLIPSSCRQLVTVITLLSFGANAFAADFPAPTPDGSGKATLTGVTQAEVAKKNSSWTDTILPVKEPVQHPVAAPAAEQAETKLETSSEKKSDRAKDGGEKNQTSDPNESLCVSLKTKKADSDLINQWNTYLGNKTPVHQSKGMSAPHKAFLGAATRALDNNYRNADGTKESKDKEGAIGVCEYSRQIEQAVTALPAKIETIKDVGGCGSFNTVYEELKDLKAKNADLGKRLEVIVNGRSDGANRSLTLLYLYQNGMQQNLQNIQQFAGATASTKQTSAELVAIQKEYVTVWGERKSLDKGTASGAKKPAAPNGNDGFFTRILGLYRGEIQRRKKIDETLEAQLQSMNKKSPGCLSDQANAEKLEPKQKPNRESGVGGELKPQPRAKDSAVNSLFEKDETDEQKIARLEKECPTMEDDSKSQAECYSRLKVAKSNVDNNKKQIAAYTSAPYNRPTPPNGSADEPEKPLRTQTFTNTETSFFSENAGLIVGGGLLVGGGAGLYFWDKYEKDKRQKEWESYWANVQAVNGTSTSTSTSTTTRTLQVKSGIGSTAVAGVNLPGIQVAIVDGSGNTASGQDVDITMACITPIPCYLTGTTTVRSVNGIATFNDVRFTQAVSNVRIRFAAPWGGVDQANSFNVNPLAGSTNTNTLTGTVTTTTTNTATSTGTDTRL